MHYKARVGGKVGHKALYNILRIDPSGMKEVPRMYIPGSEGANFWSQVLSDLHDRGLKDILVACTDNLKGFTEAMPSVYPKAEVQSCIVHQVRNPLKYVAGKDKKGFMRGLKPVYRAGTKDTAGTGLGGLAQKWQGKYPIVTRSRQDNRDRAYTYFQCTAPVRKLIYTTNAVEGPHRQIRKVTKAKGAFTSDMALQKPVYLATGNIEKKWASPLRNWGLTVRQPAIEFEHRLPLDLPVQPFVEGAGQTN